MCGAGIKAVNLYYYLVQVALGHLNAQASLVLSTKQLLKILMRLSQKNLLPISGKDCDAPSAQRKEMLVEYLP